MSRNIVFWSGGQDSTLVAVQLLRAGKFIHLVSFDNSFIGGEHQQNLEKIKRKQCMHKMTSEFGNNFKHEVFVYDGNVNVSAQNGIWVALYPLLCKDGDNAYFGAMKDDSFWHYDDKFKNVFKILCDYEDKKVNLEFPLEWYSRSKVIKELKKFGYFDFSIHSGDKL